MLYNFISRNRPTIGKFECSKLFVPGRKFEKYIPDSGEDITPRKKPAKYLGITDEQSPEKDYSKEQSEKTEHSENDKQNSSDREAKNLKENIEANYEDTSDITENTIFRSRKPT